MLFFSFVGDNGYLHTKALKKKLENQKVENDKLETYVNDMKRSVYKLHHDNRFLEKKARNELALAKDKELIVVFKDEDKLVDESGTSK